MTQAAGRHESTLRAVRILVGVLLLAAPLTGAAAAAASTSSMPSVVLAVHAIYAYGVAHVTWHASKSRGTSAITKYVTTAHPSGAGCVTKGTSCTFTSLRSARHYYFTVVASNRHGWGPTSVHSNTINTGSSNSPPPQNPVTPTTPVTTTTIATTTTTTTTTTMTVPSGGGGGGGGGGGALTSYTVSFNASGGSGTMANETETSGSAEAITINSFTRSGYNFTGWNTAADGSGISYSDGASYGFSSSISLYAQWSTVAYTVSFNASGGSGTMANETETSGSATALTTNSFTRSGYNFTGWNSAADGSGSAYANGAIYSFGSSVTLYAQWSVVGSAPVITVQPTDQEDTSGQEATFTAGASGTPSPSVQWQLSTDYGSTWSVISGATNSNYDLYATLFVTGEEFRAVFTNSAGSATSQSASFIFLEGSGNWAGYVEYGTIFNSVAGSWVVPTVTCAAGSNLLSMQWVGIDGQSSPTVEQVGTQTGCSNGVPTYNAWYEMWGDAAINGGYAVDINSGSYPLRPGDSVSASVRYTSGSWILIISDTTGGWSFSITIEEPATAPLQTSAEWIDESPTVCADTCTIPPPAQTTNVTFTNATASFNGTTGGIGDTLTLAYELSTDSGIYITPGRLNATGSTFTDVT